MQDMARESWAAFKSKRERKISEEWGNLISERDDNNFSEKVVGKSMSNECWEDELVYSQVGETQMSQ